MYGESGPMHQTQPSFMSDTIDQHVNNYNSGWKNSPGSMFSNSWNSGNGVNNCNSSHGNQPTKDLWNNEQAQSSWHGQPTPGPWNSQPTSGAWNNQPAQCSWKIKPNQGLWNNHTNRGSWNVQNHGRGMMRGPLSRGGRAMRARGFGGVSRFNGSSKSQISGGGDHYCDSCERGFSTPEDLANHQKNDHVVCGLEGCTLSAHPKIVEKHQRMQHDSGLYSRLAVASSQNPDDVEKWIKERKRNYPTKENIERKKQEAEDCLRRGEPLGLIPESRFGRNRGRGRIGHSSRGRGNLQQGCVSQRASGFTRGLHKRKRARNQRKTKSSENKTKTVELTTENVADDEPRNIPMFPGTAHLLGVALDGTTSSDEEIGEETGSFSDSEWMEQEEQDVEPSSAGTETGNKKIEDVEGKKEVEVVSNIIPLNNALGALMGTYASDDSDEDAPPLVQKIQASKGKLLCDIEVEEDKPNMIQNEKGSMLPECVVEDAGAKEDGAEESDGSAPEEVPIMKMVEERKNGGRLTNGEEEVQTSKSEEKEGGKKMRRARKRTKGHKGSAEAVKDGEDEGQRPKGKFAAGDVKKQCVRTSYVKPVRHPTLLEELLKNEIRHERNVILQCIRHIVQSNFFDQKTVLHSAKEDSSSSMKTSVTEDDSSSVKLKVNPS